MRYSKFTKDSVVKALRLVAQILGDEKVQVKEQPEVKEGTKERGAVKEAVPMFREVILDSFFGQDVKEIVRVVFAGATVEKVLGILIGPKTPVYGYESILPSSGYPILSVETWEDNKSLNSSIVVQSRKLTYSAHHLESVFSHKELVDSFQSYIYQKK